MAGALHSPGPTPEALVGVKLRRMEESQPETQTHESLEFEDPHHEAAEAQNDQKGDRKRVSKPSYLTHSFPATQACVSCSSSNILCVFVCVRHGALK